MPARAPEKVAFLNAELAGLRSRINGEGNAVQMQKMAMLRDIRDDYQQSLERAQQRAAEEQE